MVFNLFFINLVVAGLHSYAGRGLTPRDTSAPGRTSTRGSRATTVGVRGSGRSTVDGVERDSAVTERYDEHRRRTTGGR